MYSNFIKHWIHDSRSSEILKQKTHRPANRLRTAKEPTEKRWLHFSVGPTVCLQSMLNTMEYKRDGFNGAFGGARETHWEVKHIWNTMQCKKDSFSGALGGASETHWECVSHCLKSMWNTAAGIKNCKQLFSLRLAFTTQKKLYIQREWCLYYVLLFYSVVNASSSEKSCLQFSIPIGSGVGEEGGVSHRLKNMWNTAVGIKNCKQLFCYGLHLRPKKKQHIQRRWCP